MTLDELAARSTPAVPKGYSPDVQWCATGRRWFEPDANMAGACQTCRTRIEQEQADGRKEAAQ